jgi:hypothetical protein
VLTPVQARTARRKELLKSLQMETVDVRRRRMWKEQIQLEEVRGGGISKAASKFYASWFRTARHSPDTVLETSDDNFEIIEWRGIRANLEQLGNCFVHRIEAMPPAGSSTI